MKRNIKVTDLDTGEILNDVEITGGYNITYSSFHDDGRLKYIRTLDNGKFDDNYWIKSDIYRPVANKLVEKFDDLKHISLYGILFIEDMKWKPGADNKPWIAKISKANKQLKSVTGYDFVLKTRHWFTREMSREQIIALIYHELKHIDIDGELLKHDIEDWGYMVATLGSDWATTKDEILNILNDDFEEWDELRKAGNQMSMYENVVNIRAAK